MGANAREQLLDRERLGDVVRGAGVEARNLVGHLGARGEHDDRQRRLGHPDLPEDLEAAATGQHHVKDHEVEVARHRSAATVDPVHGHLHRVAVRPQRPLDEVRDTALVLDEKDAHRDVYRSRRPHRR